jgi:hypothetical protein
VVTQLLKKIAVIGGMLILAALGRDREALGSAREATGYRDCLNDHFSRLVSSG